uniref:Uncharacterized protein n=2 Tax=Pyricularia oryzae TaxID=318829 RepID=Q2KGX9_PYRO7|nr:hypothetical protein MGCH7_ch7g206 [Pyricularia oryzae 70-15]
MTERNHGKEDAEDQVFKKLILVI